MVDNRNKTPTDLREFFISSIRTLDREIGTLERTISELTAKISRLETQSKEDQVSKEDRIKQLELELEKVSIRKSTADSDLSKLRDEIEEIKKVISSHLKSSAVPAAAQEEKSAPPAVKAKAPAPSNANRPLLQGNGFSAVTREYLDGMKRPQKP